MYTQNEVTSSQTFHAKQITDPAALPVWMTLFATYRFEAVDQRGTKRRMTLRDVITSFMTHDCTGIEKEKRAAYAFCNDTGTLEGTPNGLIQIDFDHLGDGEAERFKADVSRYPGILYAGLSASGRNVWALIYAPDREGGLYATRQIAAFMASLGYHFANTKLELGKVDDHCDGAHQLRYQAYDPAPFVADFCAPIAPDYSTALTRSGARRAFEIWTNGRPIQGDDYEQAVTAIFDAALCVNIAGDYGIKPFRGSCDVQILGDSGSAKTQGRIMPLRRIAQANNVRLIGGLRATDAAFYDEIINAACDVQRDDKGKPTGITVRTAPNPLACILDESGDTETSRRGNQAKAQQNLIRRIACFDTDINIGCTAEQMRTYGGYLPSTLPVKLLSYRTTTPNQLKGVDFDDEQEGGNGRRTLYAAIKPAPKTYLNIDDFEAKKARILYDQIGLEALNDKLARRWGNARARTTFTADESANAASAARQAARLAFERAHIPKDWGDTVLYNTALFLAAIRCADQDLPDTFITANDLETACAVALNSFACVRALTSASKRKKLEIARTDSERTRLIVEYIEGRKSGDVGRSNLARYFGKDVLETVKTLCDEGILTEFTKKNAQGKNPAIYYRVTPEGEQAQAASDYKKKQEARRPKTRIRGKGGSVWDGDTQAARREYAECDEAEKTKRLESYWQKHEKDNPLVEGNRNNSMAAFVTKLCKDGMYDDTAHRFSYDLAISSGLPEMEAQTVTRPRDV